MGSITGITTFRSKKTGNYGVEFEYDGIIDHAEFWDKNHGKFDVENMECNMLADGSLSDGGYRSYEFHDEL